MDCGHQSPWNRGNFSIPIWCIRLYWILLANQSNPIRRALLICHGYNFVLWHDCGDSCHRFPDIPSISMVAAILNIVFGTRNLWVIAFISTTAKSAKLCKLISKPSLSFSILFYSIRDQREELCPHFPIKQSIASLVRLFGEAFIRWGIEF